MTELNRIKARSRFLCPHCRHENSAVVDVTSRTSDNRFFVRCDQEDGGCDRLLAIEVEVVTVVTPYRLESGQVAEVQS